MIFSQDRATLRRMYRDAWRKFRDGETLSPLEAQVAAVVAEHPEYHAIVQRGSDDADYQPEDGSTNPYLHMGLHLAIRDQVATNRPPGIAECFQQIAAQGRDANDAEHRMMEALGETLWDAQRAGTPPDDGVYLERLRRLAARRGR